MKKSMYCIAAALFMLGASACSNGGNKSATDSLQDTVVADTVDSAVAQDTVPAVEVNPEKDLALSVEKKNLNYLPESSGKAGSLTVKVTNNSTVAIKGSAYKVAYDEIVEDWVGSEEDGGLEDVTKKRTAVGKDVNPGESVLIELKASDGCQDLKNPKIVNAD